MNDTTTARQTINRFVRSTALRRRLWFLLASFATHGLAVGAALYVIDWAWPSIHPEALFIGLLWLGAVLVWHLLNPGLSLRSADGTLGLQDRLTTWWSRRSQSADDATRWLEEDLCSALEDLPKDKHGRLWRRPMRRLLWVLPLLLLVWWIGPIGQRFFMASPTGVTEHADRGPHANEGNVADKKGTPDPNRKGDRGKKRKKPDPSKPGKKPDGKSKESKKPPPEKPVPNKPDEKPDPKGQKGQQNRPPRPILPIPGAEEFVVPDFIGEGDGKKQKTRVAVIEEPETGGPGTGAKPETKGTKGDAKKPPPSKQTREYERAAEEALRSRHVPERERDFVKRYFRELLGKRQQP